MPTVRELEIELLAYKQAIEKTKKDFRNNKSRMHVLHVLDDNLNKILFLEVDGERTNIKRGSVRHAEIDATHRMRSDGSYFKDGGN